MTSCAVLRRAHHLPPLLSLHSLSTITSTRFVSLFWDLNNKPPSSLPPYDAAVRLHLAASAFGRLRFSVAYATHHAFRHLRLPSAPSPPHRPRLLCRLCGRPFFDRSKLLLHFDLHRTEHLKRQRRIDAARGGRRVRLASELALKMEKYRKAERELLVPDVGRSFGGELRRAGVVVRSVEDCPEAARRALGQHMVDTVERGRVGCLVLVSDDPEFCGVLQEARGRGLRTVVVGEEGDGVLKRVASTGLSWKDVVSGKAREEAVRTVGRWKDRDLLDRLEWRYEPEEEGEEQEFEEFEGESDGEEDVLLECKGKEGSKPWWKLD